MKTQIIIIQHQVNCDLCGRPIHHGEKCKMITDEAAAQAYFTHLKCPFKKSYRSVPKPILANNKCALA